MDHFGYKKDTIRYYLSGALAGLGQDTIRHLFANVEDREWLSKKIKKKIFTSLRAHKSDLARWLFREGYVVFTEQDWERLKAERADLYEALSVDV